jgi:diguanylate cyclase (GGDEF) domain
MRDMDIISERLKTFHKMYNFMRIVDPISKKVLQTEGNILNNPNVYCYNFWEQQRVCENCISMRAYNEDDCFFKIEYKPGIAYLIIALPVEVEGTRYVIELIKEGTNSIFIGSNEEEDRVLSSIDFMRQSIIKDELTGLFNRRYVNEKLPGDLLASFAKNKPLSVIYIDFDGFKHINDFYGHSAGDYMLREFSIILKEILSEERFWAARLGGDEFLVCLSETDTDTANEIVGQIHFLIQKYPFIFETHQLDLSISCGVHTVINTTSECTTDQIIAAADKEMYRIKVGKKNRYISI